MLAWQILNDGLKVASMRAVEECLARAADMDRQAKLRTAPDMNAEFLAKRWRDVAHQATWRDAPGSKI